MDGSSSSHGTPQVQYLGTPYFKCTLMTGTVCSNVKLFAGVCLIYRESNVIENRNLLHTPKLTRKSERHLVVETNSWSKQRYNNIFFPLQSDSSDESVSIMKTSLEGVDSSPWQIILGSAPAWVLPGTFHQRGVTVNVYMIGVNIC